MFLFATLLADFQRSNWLSAQGPHQKLIYVTFEIDLEKVEKVSVSSVLLSRSSTKELVSLIEASRYLVAPIVLATVTTEVKVISFNYQIGYNKKTIMFFVRRTNIWYIITWMLHQIFMYSNKLYAQPAKISIHPSIHLTQSLWILLNEGTDQWIKPY